MRLWKWSAYIYYSSFLYAKCFIKLHCVWRTCCNLYHLKLFVCWLLAWKWSVKGYLTRLWVIFTNVSHKLDSFGSWVLVNNVVDEEKSKKLNHKPKSTRFTLWFLLLSNFHVKNLMHRYLLNEFTEFPTVNFIYQKETFSSSHFYFIFFMKFIQRTQYFYFTFLNLIMEKIYHKRALEHNNLKIWFKDFFFMAKQFSRDVKI